MYQCDTSCSVLYYQIILHSTQYNDNFSYLQMRQKKTLKKNLPLAQPRLEAFVDIFHKPPLPQFSHLKNVCIVSFSILTIIS